VIFIKRVKFLWLVTLGPYKEWIHVQWVLHFWMKTLILKYLTACDGFIF